MIGPNDFIRYLEQLRDREDRAALASLRRGLGQPAGAVFEVRRIVDPKLSSDTPPRLETACYIVAPLFAEHPQAGGVGNMGRHFRAMCGPLAPGEPLPANIERRFMALLASDLEELPDALRQAVKLLKSRDVPVHWRQLLNDVLAWINEDGDVQKNWSRAFWRPSDAAVVDPSMTTSFQP